MKKRVGVGTRWLAAACVALLTLGLAGCGKEQQTPATGAACAITAATNAVGTATNGAPPAAMDPSKAVPKDHPAH